MSMTLDPAANSTYFSVILVGRVEGGIFMIIAVVVLCYELFTFVGFVRKREMSSELYTASKFKMRCWLLLNTFCYICLSLFISIIALVNFETLNGDVCSSIVMTVAIFYLIQKAFAYLLLYERIAIVHNMMSLNDRWHRRSRQLLIVVVIATPLFAFWTVFVYFRGKQLNISQGQTLCDPYSTGIFPLIFFLVLDFVLNMLLLVLFVSPIYRQAEKIRALHLNDDSAALLYRMSRMNCVVSLIMISSVFFSVCFFTVVSRISLENGLSFTPLEYSKLLVVNLDGFISMLGCHVMCLDWLLRGPRRSTDPSRVISDDDVLVTRPPSTLPSQLGQSQDHFVNLDSLHRDEASGGPADFYLTHA